MRKTCFFTEPSKFMTWSRPIGEAVLPEFISPLGGWYRPDFCELALDFVPVDEKGQSLEIWD